jgi:hypothetical protein
MREKKNKKIETNTQKDKKNETKNERTHRQTQTGTQYRTRTDRERDGFVSVCVHNFNCFLTHLF